MRVLVVTNDFPSSFNPVAGVFVFKQVEALRRIGHDVSVLRVVPLAPPLGAKWHKYRVLGDGYTYEGLKVDVARTVILPGRRNFECLHAQTSRLMKKAIERYRPQIVHAQYLQYPGSISVARGTPALITSHGSDAYDWPFGREGLLRDAVRTLQKADTVVAVSGFIAASLRRIFDRRIEVVFNGGDIALFGVPDRNRARELLGVSPERRVLAFAGTHGAQKGIFDLVEALKPLRDPPLLLACGDGPEAAAFATALREAGIEARLFGGVTQSTVAQVFAAADVVTLPSHNEGLPVTICEAMLSQRPVVATTVGGIPEIVEHGETGLLCEPRNVPQLTALYARIFSDADAAAAMGSRAAEFARGNLTWEANARAYDRLYRDLVRERAA